MSVSTDPATGSGKLSVFFFSKRLRMFVGTLHEIDPNNVQLVEKEDHSGPKVFRDCTDMRCHKLSYEVAGRPAFVAV